MTDRNSVFYGEEEKEFFSYDLDHCVHCISSNTYSPRLAHLLAAFSASVYEGMAEQFQFV